MSVTVVNNGRFITFPGEAASLVRKIQGKQIMFREWRSRDLAQEKQETVDSQDEGGSAQRPSGTQCGAFDIDTILGAKSPFDDGGAQ